MKSFNEVFGETVRKCNSRKNYYGKTIFFKFIEIEFWKKIVNFKNSFTVILEKFHFF